MVDSKIKKRRGQKMEGNENRLEEGGKVEDMVTEDKRRGERMR